MGDQPPPLNENIILFIILCHFFENVQHKLLNSILNATISFIIAYKNIRLMHIIETRYNISV
jgi:hypothetical protein